MLALLVPRRIFRHSFVSHVCLGVYVKNVDHELLVERSEAFMRKTERMKGRENQQQAIEEGGNDHEYHYCFDV